MLTKRFRRVCSLKSPSIIPVERICVSMHLASVVDRYTKPNPRTQYKRKKYDFYGHSCGRSNANTTSEGKKIGDFLTHISENVRTTSHIWCWNVCCVFFFFFFTSLWQRKKKKFYFFFRLKYKCLLCTMHIERFVSPTFHSGHSWCKAISFSIDKI